MFRLPGSGLLGSDSHVFLPMMIGCPMVVSLKCAISSGSFQGREPSRPIALSFAIATIAVTCLLRKVLELNVEKGIVWHMSFSEIESGSEGKR